MKIYLIGYMGSGKTTIGQRLSTITGLDFLDTDHIIETAHHTTITEIFAKHGEASFRSIEHQTLLQLQATESAIISTGGGMPCHSGNIDLMLATGHVIYLKATPKNLAHNLINASSNRPLIKGKTASQLQEYIIEQLSRRETYYSMAHTILHTENFSTEELLHALLTIYR